MGHTESKPLVHRLSLRLTSRSNCATLAQKMNVVWNSFAVNCELFVSLSCKSYITSINIACGNSQLHSLLHCGFYDALNTTLFVTLKESINVYYSASVGKRGIVMSVYVCLSICICFCLCVCPPAYPRKYTPDILICVTYGRSSVLLRRRCDTLCTSGFMDDVIFARDGPCRGLLIPLQ